jgi:hypothetical protein
MATVPGDIPNYSHGKKWFACILCNELMGCSPMLFAIVSEIFDIGSRYQYSIVRLNIRWVNACSPGKNIYISLVPFAHYFGLRRTSDPPNLQSEDKILNFSGDCCAEFFEKNV